MAEIGHMEPELITLRSILLELERRGHRIRHPINTENKIASPAIPLAGNSDEAENGMEAHNERSTI
jgi:hypothetical protein